MIDDVIRREGGIVDHSVDRGGLTNFGIIQRTLTRHLGRKTNKHDARKLSRELAAEIYRRDYDLEPRLDTLPDGLNRLPRPLIKPGILGPFVPAPADPHFGDHACIPNHAGRLLGFA